jgi:hypothetical protein
MMNKALMIVVGVLSLALAYFVIADRHHKRVAFENALARDSVEAANDTTRKAIMSAKDSARILGDSLNAVTRRSIQLELSRDSLDRALHSRSTSRTNVVTRIPGVSGTATSSVAHTDSGRTPEHSLTTSPSIAHATFNVRRVPFSLFADVKIPSRGEASMNYDIKIDSISMSIRTTCGDVVRGVRQASVNVIAPTWANVNIARTEQSRDVCNADRGASSKKRARRWNVGATFGYGAVFSRDESNAFVMHRGVGGTLGISFRIF